MPVTLVTGLPGHGKTLYALYLVEERRRAEARAVYSHGIPELTLPWEPLENPKAWFELPEGSIVVIDECQRVFPTRGNAKAVPQFISEFETHRHRGLDIYLITQAPTFIDAHLRKLVDRHIHVMRPFGHKYAVIFEWQYVVTDPMKDGYHKHALKKRWKHAKEVYGWYKSSTMHTVQKRLPMKAVMLPVAAAVAVGLFYVAKTALLGDSPKSIDSVNAPAAEVARSHSTKVGSVPEGTLELARQLRAEPLAGYSLHAAGVIEMRGERRVLVSAEKEGRAVTFSDADLTGMGYRVEELGACALRVVHGVSVRYAVCKGRTEGAPRQDVGNGGHPRRWVASVDALPRLSVNR